MNPFLASSLRAISRNAVNVVYTSLGAPVYNVETGKNEPTKALFNIRCYPKQIKANQYNFPNLVGKELVQFFIANNNLGFSPKAGDLILYKTISYRVAEVVETSAHGQIVLYRVVGVKG